MKCIFCGCDAVIYEEHHDPDYSSNDFYVYCKSCVTRGPKFKNPSFAILTWNSIANIIKSHFDA